MTMLFQTHIPARMFGFDSDGTVLGFEPIQSATHPAARLIPIDANHVFDPLVFEQMRLWWEFDDTRAPLYLSGPSGCGKTSTVLQFLARVHQPVLTVTCHRRMDKSALLGTWGVAGTSGQFRWFDGPAGIAWRDGYVLLINEFSLAPAEVWVACNDILEGDALYNERLATVIDRHPNARVIITDNCRCGENASSRYKSRQPQDLSTIDRFWHIRCDWPSVETEAQLLMRACLPYQQGLTQTQYEDILLHCAKFAAHSRKRPDDSPHEPIAISTRVLMRFAQVLLKLVAERAAVPDPVQTALDLVYAQGLPPVEGLALVQLARLEFGPRPLRRID